MSNSDTENEITVEIAKDAIVVKRTGGGAGKGKIEFDDLRREIVEVFQFWLCQGHISRRTELEVLGKLLYATLFNDSDQGNAKSFLEQNISNAFNNKSRLRIQLEFDDTAADLASLPWEYLYCAPKTSKGFFLSTHVDLVLSRFIETDKGRNSLKPEESPLRILVVVSQPADLAPVVAEPVIEAIQKLAEKVEKSQIMIERCDKPTIDNLLLSLEKTKPHVLHFIGHGRFDQQKKQGEIALLNYEETNAEWCPDNIFAEYFINVHAVPRLVLLHLCQGGEVDFEANFAGLAPQLILAGIQAVVAMQYRIPNKAAIAFSRAFYAELAKGNPVDQAVQEGRWRITVDDPKTYDSRIFGTPVLYMHSRDGIILAKSDTSMEETAPEQKSSSSRSGPFTSGSIIDTQLSEKQLQVVDKKTIGLIQRAAMKAAGSEQNLVSEAINKVNWETSLEKIEEQIAKCSKDEQVELVSIFNAMLIEIRKQR